MTWLIDLKTLLVGSLSSRGSIAAAASTRWAQTAMRRPAKRGGCGKARQLGGGDLRYCLLLARQRELKDGTARLVCRGPYSSAMRLDDRPADR